MGSTSAKGRRGPRPRGLVKRTIVVSKTRDAVIRRAVAEGRAPSASGYIEEALAAFETEQSYEEFLADWRRDMGPATAEEKAWAADAVRNAVRNRPRKLG